MLRGSPRQPRPLPSKPILATALGVPQPERAGLKGSWGSQLPPPANGPPIRTAVTLVAKTPRMMGSQREDWYLYDVLLDGQPIVTGSRVPEYDLARALLGRGIIGIADVFDGKTGKHRTIVNIEAAAEGSPCASTGGTAFRS